MTKLCFILGDQLSETIPSLLAINKRDDLILMCEVWEEANYVPHHPKKIAFIFTAMRHFALGLERSGYRVRYIKYDDTQNTGCFEKELLQAIEVENIREVHITHPGEWRVLEKIKTLQKELSIPLFVYEDDRFLCSIKEFKDWTENKKQLRMEYFYRMMRQKYSILIDENSKPYGGSWNYDAENRKNANHLNDFPVRFEYLSDEITIEVLNLVEGEFAENFGDLHPFNFAVTREQALNEAHYFIKNCLAYFGDYQDAMLSKEAYLYHSRLSFYLNIGLLLPLEICRFAEDAYMNKSAPLNAVEGFIRQILGWREYVRGIYWLYMPRYLDYNFFEASRKLPDLFWGAKTSMHCLQEVVKQTKKESYSHHIQRLMITGNFALLCGLNPKEVCDWYLAVYADAFEWVELPNTLGMALYADGGIMASKPYAASGKYINKMSDFCKSCVFCPEEVVGEKACPYNSLYWHFIVKNQHKLKNNLRLKYTYATWNKMFPEKRQKILDKAQSVLNKLEEGGL